MLPPRASQASEFLRLDLTFLPDDTEDGLSATAGGKGRSGGMATAGVT